MLKEIEQQVAAMLAADTPASPFTVSVGLRRFKTNDAFQYEQQATIAIPIPIPKRERRRLLPVTFDLHITVRITPADETAQAVRDAHELLLEQVALIAHRLADPDVRSGHAFMTKDKDRGYAVESLALARATIGDTVAEDRLAGDLRYHGTGSIWPPGEPLLPPPGWIEKVNNRTALVEANAALTLPPEIVP